MTKKAQKPKKLVESDFIEIVKKSLETEVIEFLLSREALGFTLVRYINGTEGNSLKTALRLSIEVVPTDVARAEMKPAKLMYIH